ncbi:apiosidase-like domain-containing protein [Dyadobacter fanqingshengii]|uniref:Glycoside hydrolase family 140 protein n=1 Tax=Dyadobacter fanqingshengii TaxID=2906443 RepID=A0A9X1P7U9_9BACT|nr:DUF4038 domain-containing protein [Dyadobacter fanqingshengii]MCF0039587.1 glycoside hydrolase family 140 protein [Dyadobacter fanqingshengii]USJ38643.1 glycoside hydrolase family 140 protein [Dyadobacter fanqingshengii]
MKWLRYFIFSILAASGLAAVNVSQKSEQAVPKFPLRISPNGRHITDNNGVPFLMVADVAWQMLRKLGYNDAIQYMDTRKSQSFNTFLVQLLPALPNQRNFNKTLPFQDNDISRPNKLYFDYFDKIIAAAKERNLVVGIVVSRKSWNALFDAQNAAVWKNYGAYVGKHFAKYSNVIWIVSEEEYQTAAQFEAIADGIRSVSEGQILASLSTCSPTSVNDSSKVRSDLKFIIPDSTVTPAEYAALANWQKNSAEAALRPFLIANSEFPKEITDQSVLIRNQAYQSIMSAAAGFCHMSTIKNFNPTWKVNIGKDGAEYIHELVKILKGIPWEYMQPENVSELLPDSADKAEIGIVSLSNKKMSMLYLPESRPVRLNLNYLNGKDFGAVWYSPRTGKRWTGGDFKATPEAIVQPPDSQPGWDWILLIGAKR